MGLVQEGGFLAVNRLPVVNEVDAPAIGEGEAGDVDRVAEGVFRKPRAGHRRCPGSYRRRTR